MEKAKITIEIVKQNNRCQNVKPSYAYIMTEKREKMLEKENKIGLSESRKLYGNAKNNHKNLYFFWKGERVNISNLTKVGADISSSFSCRDIVYKS